MRAKSHRSAGVEGGPTTELEQRLLEHRDTIETWLHAKWQQTPPPFYCSVDLRNAGFKLAPVDTNLFPAGFNNLPASTLRRSADAARTALTMLGVEPVQRVLLIPENHTRNLFYLDNIGSLVEILSTAGFVVRVGSLLPDLAKPRSVPSHSRGPILLEPVVHNAHRIGIHGFDPDLVLLNNDLAAGTPPVLADIAQPVVPPVKMGWTHRRKSGHFAKYSILVKEFCQLLRMDQWSIDPLHRQCRNIDFRTRQGEDRLADAVGELLNDVGRKYKENGVERTPFAVIKADAGTYGMSVMMVRSADEVRHFSHRQRNKMAVAKDGMPVTEVIVQEGLKTTERAADGVAEPVIYLIGRDVVGGFHRMHPDKNAEDNLNAPGMQFVPMPLTETEPTAEHLPAARRYAYSVIGRLAALAAAREILDATSGRPS